MIRSSFESSPCARLPYIGHPCSSKPRLPRTCRYFTLRRLAMRFLPSRPQPILLKVVRLVCAWRSIRGGLDFGIINSPHRHARRVAVFMHAECLCHLPYFWTLFIPVFIPSSSHLQLGFSSVSSIVPRHCIHSYLFCHSRPRFLLHNVCRALL